MSSGQKPRTPEHFPRMKYRAAGRHARHVRANASDLADIFAWLGEIAKDVARQLTAAFAELGSAFTRAVESIDWGAVAQATALPRELEPAPAAGNPEDAVIEAINGLENDEIGDIVRWQLEQGMARGDHIRPVW